PGTLMDVFPVACAEGSSVPRADFDPSFLPGPDSPLYAIVRTVPFPMLSTEKGYALIYSTPYVWGAQLYIDGGRIVSFVSCGASPADAVGCVPPEDVILAPRR
ncbi:MAG TPA: hypothetical protein VN697_05965, partial [Tepidiformaceae bacterium]|nr:hypothetical protein [Tepidiformaceae bacterium]